MAIARLEVTEALGQRTVLVDKPCYRIGRRDTNDLKLAGSEVSREHAEIVEENGQYILRDRGSTYGTYVNDTQVTEQSLNSGDRIRLGRGGGAEIVFSVGDTATVAEPSTASAIGDLRHVAALLEGLRALGAGRVLDDVLALVLDSALAVSGAERGFIMLATPEDDLEFKLARNRGRVTLPGRYFEASRKIPLQVFQTGKPIMVADLIETPDGQDHQHTIQIGIRHVQCVPLRLVRYLDRQEGPVDEQRIGVLYLDSREKGSLLSNATKAALETLATEAAIAIENARLYRETMEKARMEQEMRIAAEIQRALLPRAQHEGAFFEAAALTIPTRSIGGDFFDYLDLSDGRFAFALGDVAGKGPPAALLSALVQGIFAGQGMESSSPAETVERVNAAMIRRAIEARYVTLMYGQLAWDGKLTYCNAGHNPPFIVGKGGLRRLEVGGRPAGMFEGLPFDEETLKLSPGDWVVVFSDGVSEALSATGEEFGEDRIVEVVNSHLEATTHAMVEALVARVKEFTRGAPQSDDLTALVIRYRG
jgi:serine phosphatase RsbU (regulator of sigma subunit)